MMRVWLAIRSLAISELVCSAKDLCNWQ